jgi:hypothetical protein
VTIDELERDPHGVFRRYRRQFPFSKRADGTALVLRNSDVQQLFTDPRTRQSEKEFFELRGIQEAPCSICSNIQWSLRMDLTIVGAGRRSQRRSPLRDDRSATVHTQGRG